MSDCSRNAFKTPKKHGLKPCPFCGAEATHEMMMDGAYSWNCEKCGAQVRFPDDCTLPNGASDEAWNTRHVPTCTVNEEEITGFEGISFTIASCGHCGKLTFPGVRYCQSCGCKVVPS